VVGILGTAIAENIFTNGTGLDFLKYDEFNKISKQF
jgi:hypothetical protein